jgi:hypothetical protein
MNIAIVIAVSNYTSPGNNLPASKKDGEIMSVILNATKKYEKVLTINSNETSSQTKEILSNFFVECKGVKIDELFFYYSGHGEFSNDEFYYLLSDFDHKRKNQTSLQNNEVDDLIRTLNPHIVVKVIDACQSGTSYIKESDVLTKYFNETKKGFNKCYFLNSSLSNQASYQDENLSFFTYSFIQALKDHPTSEIRYKDIIDFILDEFNGNQDQTPFFVIQAELTEKFCSLTPEFKNILSASDTLESNKEQKKTPSLLDLVKTNAKEYVDKEGALQALEFTKTEIEKMILDKEIQDLYELKIFFFEDNNTLVGVNAIGRWLKNNTHDFFAKPQYSEYYDEDGEVVYISGYELLIDGTTYKSAIVEILGKYPNVKSYRCNVALLVSKKQLTFFYSILQYIENGWDDKNIKEDGMKWTYTNSKIADNKSIQQGIKSIAHAINDRIKSDISIQFGLKADEEKSTNDEDDLPF